MNEESCSLVYTGKILDGMTFERVHQNLAAIYKADMEKIKQRFSEKRSIIKQDTDRETCRKIQKRLLEAGAICDIMSGDHTVEPPDVASIPAEPSKTADPGAAINPYAAPRSELKTEGPKNSPNFTGPAQLSASRGAAWFFQAISLFLKSPFMWILTMICLFLVGLVQIIPIIGPVALTIFTPVLMAGLLIGARDLDEQGELKVGCIFHGFQNGFGQLVLLGLVFLAAMVVAAVVAGGVGFGLFGFSMANPESGFPVAAALLLPLLFLAIFIPVMMGYWFSPALIAIDEKPVFEAISLSFKACWKNILPFLVYALVASGVMIGLMLVCGAVAGVLAAGLVGMGLMAAFIPFLLMLPVFLALMPIYFSSIYISYRDIFYTA